MIHKLLARQLRLLSLNEMQVPNDLDQWTQFIEKINKVYVDNDQDRYLLERSLQLSSKEMQERWSALDFEKAKNMQAAKFSTLGEMAGSIAHEINNPIGIINLIASQLHDLIDEDPINKEDFKTSIKQIEDSAWRAAKIVKGLRGFSRDGSNDPFVSCSIKKILDDILVFCSERFKQHNVSLKISQTNPDIRIECREVEVCQVLLNLLNNSFDAIQPLENKWIHLTVLEKNENIEIAVVDCGQAISAEITDKLFQPFFTTKEIGKGTGLGLSISKKIAENHGGSLSFDKSSSNTRFVLTIAKRNIKPSSVHAA